MTGLLLMIALLPGVTIQGTVRVEGSREPIAHATVRISELDRETRTDRTGAFVMDDLPEGRWRVQASAPGHRAREVVVRTSAGATVRLDLELTAQPQAPPSVRGVMVSHGTGAPVEGAIVALVSERGETRVGTLTDRAGRFHIVAPGAGRYRLRAERIGFESVLTSAFALAPGATVERRLRAPSRAIELEGITATVTRRCAARPDRGPGTQRLWDEARKALLAVALTEELGLVTFRTRIYERDLDFVTSRVEREDTQSQLVLNTYPFRSPPVAELIERGFVRLEADTAVYFAPDAHVLLSDEFLNTHCFHVRRRGAERPTLVGLAFEPVPERRGKADVTGVLWIDEQSAQLDHIEYRYTRVPISTPPYRFGGRLDLERLVNGAWIVREWSIRMPRHRIVRRDGEATLELAVRERGGAIQAVRHLSGSREWAASTGVVRGVVVDAADRVPIAGTRLYLSGTSRQAVSDADGRFRIDSVPRGVYLLAGYHPRLDPDGRLTPAREVAVAADADRFVELRLPGLADRLAAACIDPGRALVGVVRDEVSGTSLAGAWVGLTRRGAGGEVGTVTDEEGRYRICDVPVSRPLTLHAEFAGRTSPPRRVSVEKGGVTRQDFTIALTTPGTITGRVLHARDGTPVPSATVRLPGQDEPVLTGPRGDFRMTGLAPGTHQVEISHLEYGTHTVQLVITGGTTARTTIRVDGRGAVIDGGAQPADRREVASDFHRRRRQGLRGTFFTGDEVRANPRVVADLLRTRAAAANPVRADPNERGGAKRRECARQVYVDGILVSRGEDDAASGEGMLRSIDLTSLEGIEVYPRAGGVPPEFGGNAAPCGVVAVWTGTGR